MVGAGLRFVQPAAPQIAEFSRDQAREKPAEQDLRDRIRDGCKTRFRGDGKQQGLERGAREPVRRAVLDRGEELREREPGEPAIREERIAPVDRSPDRDYEERDGEGFQPSLPCGSGLTPAGARL